MEKSAAVTGDQYNAAIEAQETLMNPVVHFEMPAIDRKRMADFYSRAFGWRTQMLVPEMGNYVVVTTTGSDKNGRPKTPGMRVHPK